MILLGLASPAWAKTIYVNKLGSDSNNCTTAQSMTDTSAKLTIKNAITNCIVAGDTLMIGDGTYNERIASQLQSIPSGTAGSPTIIRAENARLAILQPNDATLADGWFHCISLTDPKSYITFDGIKCDASLTEGYGYMVSTQSGILQGIILQNGEATGADGDCAGYFPTFGYISGCAGVVIGSHSNPTGHRSIQLLSMYAHGNTEGGFYISGAVSVTVDGVESARNGYAFQMYDIGNHSSSNLIVRKSNFHDNVGHPGYPTFNWSVMLTDAPGLQFINNVVANNRGGVYLGFTTQANAQVLSNTITRNTLACIHLDPGASNTTIRNNVCRLNGADTIENNGSTAITQSNNLMATDPLFVSEGAQDFRLRTGSPAIATGVFSALVSTDKDGNARPNPPSRGAYEPASSTLIVISPSSGNQGATFPITVAGINTNFVNATSAMTFSGTGITVNSTTVTSPTAASVSITLAGGATLGARNVTMTTGAEVVTLTNGFTVGGAPTAPTNLRTVFDPLIAVPRLAFASEGR